MKYLKKFIDGFLLGFTIAALLAHFIFLLIEHLK